MGNCVQVVTTVSVMVKYQGPKIVIGQGGSRAVIGGTHTQSIIDGRKGIIHSDVITQLITDHRQMSLKGDSFPFDKEQT